MGSSGAINLEWVEANEVEVEAFDRATATLFIIEHVDGTETYALTASAGETEEIGDYATEQLAKAAAVEYLRREDGENFLAHGVGSSRENDLVAGDHGGNDR